MEPEGVLLGPELVSAAREGKVDRLLQLLDEGAEVDYVFGDNNTGRTALLYSSMYGQTSCVRLLLERGARVNQKDGFDYSALNYSVSSGQLEIVQMLVTHGADIHSRDISGNTPIKDAASCGDLAICQYLLSVGADLRTVSDTEDTTTILECYGRSADPPLDAETREVHCAALNVFWRAGPHSSQVRRRKDEAWDRRKMFMLFLAENRYRPLSHVVAALAAEAVDPAAAIPEIEIDTPAKRHAHLLGQVLSNEGVHRNIVSFL